MTVNDHEVSYSLQVVMSFGASTRNKTRELSSCRPPKLLREGAYPTSDQQNLHFLYTDSSLTGP